MVDVGEDGRLTESAGSRARSRVAHTGRRPSVLMLAVVMALAAAPAAEAATPAHAAEFVADPASSVNTLAGTGTGGTVVGSINNFPGPTMPFGMVQFSPDNPDTGQGYYYDNSTLRGFGLDHASQGCGALGDFPVLPTTTSMAAKSRPWTRTESYSHNGEVGRPGYYRLTSTDAAGSDITSELTASTRTGVASFSFPAGRTPSITFRSGVSNTPSTEAGAVTVDPNTGTITGWTRSGRFCGKNNTYKAYFAAKVDHTVAGYGAWDETSGKVDVGDGSQNARISDTKAGGYVSFAPGTRNVHLKIAMSYVSTDNAIQNMNTEVPTADGHAGRARPHPSYSAAFDAVRSDSHSAWNAQLGKIQVSDTAGSERTRTFYHSLYRSLLHPNTFDDVNGQYIGFETHPVVHNVSETPGEHGRRRSQYAYYSDWDTYRSLAPLQALLVPEQASDIAQSLVNDARQSGSYPRWAFANAGSNQMSGDSPVALIAQTYAFGARDFDAATALKYMVVGAVGSQAGENTGGTNDQAVERFGASIYNQRHYAPQVKDFQTDHAVAGASITEEYSIDDFAIGRMAAALGRPGTAAQFQARSNYWQNLFNPATRYISPRDSSGAFPAGDGYTIPGDFGYRGTVDGYGSVGYDEGNAEQYVWLVPQNVRGLVTALGGNDAVGRRLDTFMSHGMNPGPNEPWMWAGNEPDFAAPWIYNYIGQPWRTSQVVDQIRTTLFGTQPDGAEPGNDDLGAQSSWYVWAALGIYPATPGTDVLTVNAPAFDAARIHAGHGRTITLGADGANSGRRYINGLQVNGRTTTATWLTLDSLGRRGNLTFDLATGASRTWGTHATDAPPSFGQGSAALAIHATPEHPGLKAGGSVSLSVAAQQLIRTPAAGVVTGGSTTPGITVSPARALHFDSSGAARVSVTVHAASSVPAGTYPVAISARTPAGHVDADTTVTVGD